MTRVILISDIKDAVCEVYKIARRDLDGTAKARAIARPRQVGMYVARALTRHSYPRIGEAFGRDHSTVVHAIQNIGRLYETDPTIAAQAERVRRSAEARALHPLNTGAR